jgi:hypothetical protein
MWIREEELKRVCEMTVGEWLVALTQNDYDDYDRRNKMNNALYLILVKARNFYARKDDVCRGALAIAAAVRRSGPRRGLYGAAGAGLPRLRPAAATGTRICRTATGATARYY